MESIQKTNDIIYIRIFQICIIVSSVLGEDATYYRIANAVTLLFFLSVIMLIANNNGKMIVGKGLVLSIFFILYTTISLAWSHDFAVALSQYKTQIQLYLLVFFSYQLFVRFNRIDCYLDALYISGYAMALYALYRYGGINNYMRIMMSGVRLGAEIANQNAFGLVFSNAALVSAYYTVMKNKKWHLISGGIFVFFALSSGSRKAAVLIFVGIISVMIMKYGIKKAYKYFFFIPVVLFGAYVVLQTPIFGTINTRLTAYLTGGFDYSLQNRNNMIAQAIMLFKERPIFGYGLSNFSTFYGTYSHNNFTELLVSLGITGFTLYYLLYCLPITVLVKINTKSLLDEYEPYRMFLLLLLIDIVFGWGMVQYYGKRSMFIIGIGLSIYDSVQRIIRERGEMKCRDDQ